MVYEKLWELLTAQSPIIYIGYSLTTSRECSHAFTLLLPPPNCPGRREYSPLLANFLTHSLSAMWEPVPIFDPLLSANRTVDPLKAFRKHAVWGEGELMLLDGLVLCKSRLVGPYFEEFRRRRLSHSADSKHNAKSLAHTSRKWSKWLATACVRLRIWGARLGRSSSKFIGGLRVRAISEFLIWWLLWLKSQRRPVLLYWEYAGMASSHFLCLIL